MRSFNIKNKIYPIILIALIIRVIFLICFKPWLAAIESSQVLQSDALGYHNLALCILNGFSFCGNTFRTPGYPIFLAVIYYIFGIHPWIALIFQIILNILSVYLVYRIGAALISEKAGLWAALFLAIDPHQSYHTLTLTTDTIFVTVFLTAVLFFLKAVYVNKRIALSAVLCGIATLIRPIGLQFPFVLVFFMPIIKRLSFRRFFASSAVFIGIYAAVLLPWFIRNYQGFGHFSLSATSGYILYYNTIFTEGGIRGKSYALAEKEAAREPQLIGVSDKNNPFDNDEIYMRIAIKYIKGHPYEYSIRHFKGILNMFFNLSTGSIVEIFHLEGHELKPEFFKASKGIKDQISGFFQYKSRYEVMIGFIIFIFLLISYMLALSGMIKLFKQRSYRPLLFILGIILYFTFLTGVSGLSRYKLPVSPFIYIGSGLGLSSLLKK